MNPRRIRVWDLPVRLVHWLLLVLVVAAAITAKIGGNAMIWHGRIGQMILGLIAFRVLWGLVGSTTARFSHFVRGPGAVIDYLNGRWKGVGHNPLGALSVLALLAVIGAQAVTGLFTTDDIDFNGPLRRAVSATASAPLSGWHRQAQWLLYGLVALHVLAVLVYQLVRKDDLIGPMVTGKRGVTDPEAEGIRGGSLGALLAAATIAGLVVWISGGSWLPEPPAPPPDLGW